MSDLAKNFVVWIILAAILMFVFNSFSPETEQNDIDYSAFLSEVRNDRVSEVTIADLIIYGERNDGSDFRTVRPNVQDPKLMDDLVNHNVRIVGKEREEPSLFSQLLVAAFPILLILAIFDKEPEKLLQVAFSLIMLFTTSFGRHVKLPNLMDFPVNVNVINLCKK